MIPVGVYDFATEPVPKKDQWVTFGVPIPAWAQLRDVSNLVLVGATVSQVDILAPWPNGCARWLAIDAIIDLPEDADRVGLHLTTGQGPEGFAPIAKETESGIVMDSGIVRFTIPNRGSTLISDVAVDGTAFMDRAVSLPDGWEAAGVIERNGPALATVVVKTGSLTHRVTLARSSTVVWVDSSLLGESTSSFGLEVHSANSEAPPAASGIRVLDWAQRANSGVESVASQGDVFRVYSFTVDGQWLEPPSLTQEGGMAVGRVVHSGKEGSWHRVTTAVEFAPSETNENRLRHPLYAKALTVEAYNDTDSLGEWVGETEAPAFVPQDRSFEDIGFALYRYLGDPNPDPNAGLASMRLAVEGALARGLWETEMPGEALGLYALMANDMGVLEAYREWGARAFVESQPILDDQGIHLDEIAQRVDYFSLFERSVGNDSQPFWESFLGSYMDPSGQSVLVRSGRRGTRYLLDLARKVWGARAATPLPGAVDDLFLPAFETVVSQQVEDEPHDLVFRAGYYLTGDPQFVRDGATWLEAHPESPYASNLRSFLENYQRSIHWKPLGDLDARQVKKGQYEIAWASPEDLSPPTSLAGYFEPFHLRKHSERMTAEWRMRLMDTPAPFWLGSRLRLDGEWRKRGPDAYRIRLDVDPVATGEDLHFAGRYLARGPRLPVLKPESGPEIVELDEGLNPGRWLPWAGIALIGLALGFLVAKKRTGPPAATALLALLLWGCGGLDDPTGGDEITDGGTFHVSWRPTGDAIPFNEHFSILVTIQTVDGSALPEDLTLQVDADMPAHGHGIHTEPRVRFIGQGRFQVDGLLLHMLGEWEIYIDVVDGFVRERAVFPLTL